MILIAAACRKYSRGFRFNILTRNQKSPSVCKSTGLNARPRRLEPQSPGRPSDEPGLQAVHLEALTATLFAVCTRVCVSEGEPDRSPAAGHRDQCSEGWCAIGVRRTVTGRGLRNSFRRAAIVAGHSANRCIHEHFSNGGLRRANVWTSFVFSLIADDSANMDPRAGLWNA